MMKLPADERRAYQRYSDDLSYQASMVESSYGIGRKESKEEGREEATTAMARSLKQQGVPLETISLASGLSIEVIRRL